MQDNISKPIKGIMQDVSLSSQPKETLRFMLNGIIDTASTDSVSTEHSNMIAGSIPTGYIPIGKCYINKNRIVVFLVKDNISEIGIFYTTKKKYVTVVNDKDSINKLNFNIQNQIDAVYRLRRGCEDTIYFVDGIHARYFNFNKTEQFKTEGIWDADKFYLQKTYSKIPHYKSVEVLSNGGNLLPGDYNFSIQYIDESLNGTEFLPSTPSVKIYNDSTTKHIKEINGSINSDIEGLKFYNTTKSIKLNFENLDESYSYYRVAIICTNLGNGRVNEVLYSDIIPISSTSYTYTGDNHKVKGTQEDLLLFSNYIEKPWHIEQDENKLYIANTSGVDINYCELQNFASKITADCILKEVDLTNIEDKSNPKNPVYEFNNGLGYMPGEIYSFGIVYIIKYNNKIIYSPVCHIPGKTWNKEDIVYSPEQDELGYNVTYPMKCESTYSENEVNQGTSIYTDNNCSNFWGYDYHGYPLKNRPIRHHRFPLRSEINIPLVENSIPSYTEVVRKGIRLYIEGKIKVPVPCKEDNPDCGTDSVDPILMKAEYNYTTPNGQIQSQPILFTIDPSNFADGEINFFDLNLKTDLPSYNEVLGEIPFKNLKLYLYDGNEYQEVLTWDNVKAPEGANNPNEKKCIDTNIVVEGQFCITPTVYNTVNTIQGISTKTKLFGIKFSNINKPILNKGEVIGYYIVRNEREEFDKTILDSGVLLKTLENEKYISQGLLFPEIKTNEAAKQNTKYYGLINPEFKFNAKEYTEYDKFIVQGRYNVGQRRYGKVNFDDVFDGSSYDENTQSDYSLNDDSGPSDGSPTSTGYDGWSINIITRDNFLNYQPVPKKDINKIEERFYLDALGNKSFNSSNDDFYNIACDNRIGVLKTKKEEPSLIAGDATYGVMYKKNSDPYSNFRVLPYIKTSLNPIYFTGNDISETSVFYGDTMITPMRYVNTIFYDNRVANRRGKHSGWRIFAAIALGVVGALVGLPVLALGVGAFGLTAATFNILLGVSTILLGAGLLNASSALKIENFNRTYNDMYEKGLRKTSLDDWVDAHYNYKDNEYTRGIFGFESAFSVGAAPIPSEGTIHDDGYGAIGPSDDTIMWIADCATNFWFESSVNIALRHKFTTDETPSYLDSPSGLESGNSSPLIIFNTGGYDYMYSNAQRYPESDLERHIVKKLLAFDQTRDDNKIYLGVALGEFYHINPDYHKVNRQKLFHHLPSEYDCCSDCREKFPLRVHYSQQSFQEELNDNYRVFLPNNYRDIEGETGEITDIFIYNKNIYIHTQEALWQLPKNHQEKIVGEIVSFIGTGEFFGIPPIKIIEDDSGNSAGTIQKWATIKTPTGVFFVGHKIYHLNPEGLQPISSMGLEQWFGKNIPLLFSKYLEENEIENNGLLNNPSNSIGVGFISVYDSEYERIIFTKKDFNLDFLRNLYENHQVHIFKDSIIVFSNDTIQEYENQGWSYIGIEDDKMKFSKEIETISLINKKVWIPPVIKTYYKTYVMGFYVENDPYHPEGGKIVYSDPFTGENIEQDGFFMGYCTPIYRDEIISHQGVFINVCKSEEIITEIIEEGYYENVIEEVVETSTIYKYISGEKINPSILLDNSWTISYSLKHKMWISWHSYMPRFYLASPLKFFSWQPFFNNGTISSTPLENTIWEHNVKESFNIYYGIKKPFIVEYVSLSNPTINRIFDGIKWKSSAEKFIKEYESFVDVNDITFNKVLLYNSRQSTGIIEMMVKDSQNPKMDYMIQQIKNYPNNKVLIDKNEGFWSLNDIRDKRVNYQQPLFNLKLDALQEDYFIDKVVNINSIDINKDWTELESMRDTYLVIRFIFDKFGDIKLTFNFSIENETPSFR